MGGAVSSGKNNDELVDNLIAEGNYIDSKQSQQIFRAVDRGDFYPPEFRHLAYKDLAWRHPTIPLHLSAPCIYCKVMEALELKPNLSFLNLGSGTGYLSTMVGLAIGPNGVNHGIELQPQCVAYANEKVGKFISNCDSFDLFPFISPKFVQGNCLLVSQQGIRYDRVYCGAACPKEYVDFLKNFVKVDGLLIVPIEDRLLQLRRISELEWASRDLLTVSFASLILPFGDDGNNDDENDEENVTAANSILNYTIPRSYNSKTTQVYLPSHDVPSLANQCRWIIREKVRLTLFSRNPEYVRVKEVDVKNSRSNNRRGRNRRSEGKSDHGRGDGESSSNDSTMSHRFIRLQEMPGGAGLLLLTNFDDIDENSTTESGDENNCDDDANNDDVNINNGDDDNHSNPTNTNNDDKTNIDDHPNTSSHRTSDNIFERRRVRRRRNLTDMCREINRRLGIMSRRRPPSSLVQPQTSNSDVVENGDDHGGDGDGNDINGSDDVQMENTDATTVTTVNAVASSSLSNFSSCQSCHSFVNLIKKRNPVQSSARNPIPLNENDESRPEYMAASSSENTAIRSSVKNSDHLMIDQQDITKVKDCAATCEEMQVNSAANVIPTTVNKIENLYNIEDDKEIDDTNFTALNSLSSTFTVDDDDDGGQTSSFVESVSSEILTNAFSSLKAKQSSTTDDTQLHDDTRIANTTDCKNCDSTTGKQTIVPRQSLDEDSMNLPSLSPHCFEIIPPKSTKKKGKKQQTMEKKQSSEPVEDNASSSSSSTFQTCNDDGDVDEGENKKCQSATPNDDNYTSPRRRIHFFDIDRIENFYDDKGEKNRLVKREVPETSREYESLSTATESESEEDDDESDDGDESSSLQAPLKNAEPSDFEKMATSFRKEFSTAIKTLNLPLCVTSYLLYNRD